MLVLARKKNESIVIDGKIILKVVNIGRGRVRIGVDAPKELEVHRAEVLNRGKRQNVN